MSKKRRTEILVAIILTCAGIAPAAAVDTVALEIGTPNRVDANLGRVVLGWEVAPPGWAARWPLKWTWEARFGYWRTGNSDVVTREVYEIGVSPVVRLEAEGAGSRPYLEGGLGLHLLSDDTVGNRDLGSDYHFASHIGVGWITETGFRLGLRIQHQSNAGLEKPNRGINLAVLNLAYPLR